MRRIVTEDFQDEFYGGIIPISNKELGYSVSRAVHLLLEIAEKCRYC